MARQLAQEQLQQAAYDALTNYFNAHLDEVLEIEILPPSHEPVGSLILEDGPNLGLPKKVLVLAFIHARRLFFASRTLDLPAPRSGATPSPETKALEATRVILLFDPEHLTAANHRKRRFRSLQDEASRYQHVRGELRFLDSILTSPLHRQSKSPTLWGYRGFLMDYLLPIVHQRHLLSPGPQDAHFDMPELVARELSAVCKSGERHPKNYYAWQYARELLDMACLRVREEPECWERMLKQCVKTVKSWCCVHPSDISGWTFLAWLLQHAGVKDKADVVCEVVDYAVSVELPNESLWIFIRTVLADGLAGLEQGRDIIGDLREIHRRRVRAGEASPFVERTSQTLVWLEKYE